MGSVYILEKDILDPSVYIFFNISLADTETLKKVIWRYGIFRSPFSSYDLGLYCLLILTVYLYFARRLNIVVLIPLIAGNIASASRMVYAGFMYVMSMQIFVGRKWIIPILLIFVVVLIASVNFNGYFDIHNIFNLSKPTDEGNTNIRLYSRYKSIEIWKDHPFIGVGPGMFGGIVSSRYRSHIYLDYNYGQLWYIYTIGGIEQFWFQILAEMGIIGTLCFINFIIMLFIVLFKARKQADTDEIRNLFSALMVFIGCILIYSVGSGINIAPVLFTYCAFVGIGLGSYNNLLTK